MILKHSYCLLKYDVKGDRPSGDTISSCLTTSASSSRKHCLRTWLLET
ncbi:hypothetical protein [Nodularia sp. NIES-3585]|nr:hypothetical protein [Nodularia sp. NIES-3585]